MSVRAAVTPRTSEQQRARLVWIVLALSGIGFLFVCALAGTAVSSFINNSTTPRTATIEPRQGTQLAVRRHNSYIPELITHTMELREGDVASTGSDTSAFVTMFDGSTVQTFFSTTLRVDTLRTGQYTHNQKEISVELQSGTAIVGTADPGGYASSTYRVLTDLAEVDLANGTKVRVRVESEGNARKVTAIVDDGEATFISNGRSVKVGPGTMAWVTGDLAPVGPVAAEEELIRNGHFSEPPTSGAEKTENGGLETAAWLPIREQTDEPVSDAGRVRVVSEGLPGLGELNEVEIFRADTGGRYVKVG
ncbi:MAG TPA: hypothetical protein VM409_07870, partial [Chloroflexia bacterium]|nr:hypothetical protein [Chloroflexia bacterium]